MPKTKSYKKLMKEILKPKLTVQEKIAEKKRLLKTASAAPEKVKHI